MKSALYARECECSQGRRVVAMMSLHATCKGPHAHAKWVANSWPKFWKRRRIRLTFANEQSFNKTPSLVRFDQDAALAAQAAQSLSSRARHHRPAEIEET